MWLYTCTCILMFFYNVDSPASNDQLLLVLRELREREKSLSDTQEQLEQYRRKFSVIIHQQVHVCVCVCVCVLV